MIAINREKKQYLPYFRIQAILHLVLDVLVLFLVGLILFGPLYATEIGDSVILEYALLDNVRPVFELLPDVLETLPPVFYGELVLLALYVAAAVVALVELILNVVNLATPDRYVKNLFQKLDTTATCRHSASATLCQVAFWLTVAYSCGFMKLMYEHLGGTVLFGIEYNPSVFGLAVGTVLLIMTVAWILRLINHKVEGDDVIDRVRQAESPTASSVSGHADSAAQ